MLMGFVVLAIWPALARAQPLHPASTAIWGCDAPAGHTCYFAIISTTGAVRNFTMTAGQKYSVPGVQVGADYYFVAIDQAAPTNQPACATIVKKGGFCKASIVNAQYNN
jgi:hypothetical protein